MCGHVTAWSGSDHLTVREVQWSYQGWASGGVGAVGLVVMGAEFQLGRRESSGNGCGDGGQHNRECPKGH